MLNLRYSKGARERMATPVPIRDEVRRRLPGEGEPGAGEPRERTPRPFEGDRRVDRADGSILRRTYPSHPNTEHYWLFSAIWIRSNEHAFTAGLETWVAVLEQDEELRSRFQKSWQSMVAKLDSVSFFAESGLPDQKALLAETTAGFFSDCCPRPVKTRTRLGSLR